MVKAIVIVTTVNGEDLEALTNLESYVDRMYVLVWAPSMLTL
jgi:hypothetical protein